MLYWIFLLFKGLDLILSKLKQPEAQGKLCYTFLVSLTPASENVSLSGKRIQATPVVLKQLQSTGGKHIGQNTANLR